MPTLFRKREVWLPTWVAVLVALVFATIVAGVWCLWGESFLSPIARAPADVLVVEGWISDQGIRAAAQEFRSGKYRYIVATGGFSGEAWLEKRQNYSEEAERELLRVGLSREQVIVAEMGPVEKQRTFQMALSVRDILQKRGIHPAGITVFTRGAHARRSWKVYSKVLGSQCAVGIVAWLPPGYQTEHWWHSSERSEDLLKETVGYFFEFFLNSGRFSNSK